MTNINLYDDVNTQETRKAGGPAMELTRERVEDVLKIVNDVFLGNIDDRLGILTVKIDAINALREYFGFGLREGKDYVEAHWGDMDFIRKDLEARAGLTAEVEGRVFESMLFRLEVKRVDVTFEQLNRFFISVLSEFSL